MHDAVDSVTGLEASSLTYAVGSRQGRVSKKMEPSAGKMGLLLLHNSTIYDGLWRAKSSGRGGDNMHTLRCSWRRSGPHTRQTRVLWRLCLPQQLGCSFPRDREAFQSSCRAWVWSGCPSGDMGGVVERRQRDNHRGDSRDSLYMGGMVSPSHLRSSECVGAAAFNVLRGQPLLWTATPMPQTNV
jgi:hypothetical protein